MSLTAVTSVLRPTMAFTFVGFVGLSVAVDTATNYSMIIRYNIPVNCHAYAIRFTVLHLMSRSQAKLQVIIFINKYYIEYSAKRPLNY